MFGLYTPELDCLKKEEVRDNERGAVDLIVIVILIAVVILLAIVFKDELGKLIKSLFNTIGSNANELANNKIE